MISSDLVDQLNELERKGLHFKEHPIEKTIFILTNTDKELRTPNDILSINKCITKTKNFYYEQINSPPIGDPNCPDFKEEKIKPKVYILLEATL